MNTVLVQEMERYNTYGKAAQFTTFKHVYKHLFTLLILLCCVSGYVAQFVLIYRTCLRPSKVW